MLYNKYSEGYNSDIIGTLFSYFRDSFFGLEVYKFELNKN